MMREEGPSPDRSRLAALRVLLVVALVGLVGAATAVGPGRASGWVVNNLIPVVVVVSAIVVVFGLAALGLAALYDKHRHHR
jgi:multisubunit Na+/H+ antiporter MnhC subunit